MKIIIKIKAESGYARMEEPQTEKEMTLCLYQW